MRIYLDNGCFNRPFDDQSRLRIRLDSEAKLQIQEDIRSGLHKLVWSYILDYENSKNPFRERQKQIARWRTISEEDIEENEKIIRVSAMIHQQGFKKIDALQLACAIEAKATYFLTTDDGVLKKSHFVADIRITDPVGFIKEVSK